MPISIGFRIICVSVSVLFVGPAIPFELHFPPVSSMGPTHFVLVRAYIRGSIGSAQRRVPLDPEPIMRRGGDLNTALFSYFSVC